MLVSELLEVLDRVNHRRFGLHVQTFFGTIDEMPRNSATIYMPDGSPYVRISLRIEQAISCSGAWR